MSQCCLSENVIDIQKPPSIIAKDVMKKENVSKDEGVYQGDTSPIIDITFKYGWIAESYLTFTTDEIF